MRCLAIALLVASTLSAQDLAIRGKTILPVSGPAIESGVILIENGKIKAIGRASEIAVPDGMTVLEAAVVTPGLIDAHSSAGLSGRLNQPHDQDHQEDGDSRQAELRALDAYNRHEPLVVWLREHGITTLHTGGGPGGLLAGSSLIVKTRDAPLDDVVLNAEAMMIASLSDAARRSGKESPGTKSKMAAQLRSAFIAARAYGAELEAAADDASKTPARDLAKEALLAVLEKRRPLLITAHRDRDIHTALRIAREFDLNLVIDGASEIYRSLDAVKASGHPVFIHPTMARSSGELENLSMETAARLEAAEIPFAFQSGYEGYVPKTRVVLFEASIAVANGLASDRALARLTLESAQLLGIDERVGSLEVGKDADLVLFDGDPFEYTSHVTGVVIDGRIASTQPR
ncbi:MAG: amidohydrolase family protein [Planctomycetes bacterium]|nr:amidohydrolase family protein [Planctomycetota bacterium]